MSKLYQSSVSVKSLLDMEALPNTGPSQLILRSDTVIVWLSAAISRSLISLTSISLTSYVGVALLCTNSCAYI